ncbi:nuclear transport factor 2 family protein [Tenacibaculum sp. MEBiC06402]|uniref:nuclear transport factor 2 family protein n=1 Tax=unclassified Tenacibaculum TaxID=2635139 RepID=UPI003B9B778A
MRIYLPSLLIIFLSFNLSAQSTSEEKEIKKVIQTFFEGLHTGDSTVASKTLHLDIKIQTTFTNKEGVKILRNQKREELLKGIASKKKEDVYFEKLLSYDIKVDGNLASVWTPYEFYYNNNFSHCGANSFQLFNNNGKWEIIFLVDMRKRVGCKVVQEKK